MAEFEVEEFAENPAVPGDWIHQATATEGVGLAFALASTAMGLPIGEALKFDVIRLEIDVIERLIFVHQLVRSGSAPNSRGVRYICVDSPPKQLD